MNRIFHKHRWILTGASGYELPPGELKVYRRCACGETMTKIIKSAGGMSSEDLPIIVKDKCLIHMWKNTRDYTYFIHTDLGKIQAQTKLQQCGRCKNIRIKNR